MRVVVKAPLEDPSVAEVCPGAGLLLPEATVEGILKPTLKAYLSQR